MFLIVLNLQPHETHSLQVPMTTQTASLHPWTYSAVYILVKSRYFQTNEHCSKVFATCSLLFTSTKCSIETLRGTWMINQLVCRVWNHLIHPQDALFKHQRQVFLIKICLFVLCFVCITTTRCAMVSGVNLPLKGDTVTVHLTHQQALPPSTLRSGKHVTQHKHTHTHTEATCT